MIETISLQRLLELLIERNAIRPSRIAPMKTSVKQYANVLGYIDPSQCPPKVYLRNDRERNRLIEERACGTRSNGTKRALGIHALRNLKNNISYLLRVGMESQILSSTDLDELKSWKTSNRVSAKRSVGYAEYTIPRPYALKSFPDNLARDVKKYEQWSTRLVNRERPRSLHKRPITFRAHIRALEKLAGFLVNHKGFNASDITLSMLGEADHIMAYLDWYIEQQGRFTQGAAGTLAVLTAMNRYLALTAESEEETAKISESHKVLKAYRASLGSFVTVRDQAKRWLSLEQLECVGRSIYPLNALRMSELSEFAKRQIARGPQKEYGHSFCVLAYRVAKSLMIRLLVRIPLRQRNLREMKFNPLNPSAGQNLFKEGDKWHIRFSGDQLKISHRRGTVHTIQYEFPDILVPLLEEWITRWRPIVMESQTTQRPSTASPGQQFLFVDTKGQPLDEDKVWHAITSTTYKFTGVAVYPHLIRTIWATEYIKSTKNYIDAAYMLGDTVETVLAKYAKLLDEDCGKRANDWITRRLNHDPI